MPTSKEIIKTWCSEWTKPFGPKEKAKYVLVPVESRYEALKQLFRLFVEYNHDSVAVRVHIRTIFEACWPKKYSPDKKRIGWARYVARDIAKLHNEIFEDTPDFETLDPQYILNRVVPGAVASPGEKVAQISDIINKKPEQTKKPDLQSSIIFMGKPIDLDEFIVRGEISQEDCVVEEEIDNEFLNSIGYVPTEKLR